LDFAASPVHGNDFGTIEGTHRFMQAMQEDVAIPFSHRVALVRGGFDRAGMRLAADLARSA